MSAPGTFHIQDGRCVVVFAYDVGASIQIEEAEQRITATKERGRIKRKRPAPEYFDYHPPPLHITQELESISLGTHHTLRTVETVLYDFGAITVTYQIPLAGPFASLLPLSEDLYENPQLLEGTLRHVQSLLTTLGRAIEKPNLSEFVEDYAIFHIFSTQPALDLTQFVNQHGALLSQILRCEDQPLSDQEIREATTSQIAFGTQDLTQYCSLRYFRWFFDGWRTVKLHNGRSRAFVWCVGRVSAFHHPRLACSTAGFTQQLCGRLKEQPIPCFLAHRGEWPQIGAECDAITAPWP